MYGEGRIEYAGEETMPDVLQRLWHWLLNRIFGVERSKWP